MQVASIENLVIVQPYSAAELAHFEEGKIRYFMLLKYKLDVKFNANSDKFMFNFHGF